MHTAFLSKVCIKPYRGYTYHLCEDVNILIDDEFFKIPKGFATDLASIPRPFWCVLSPAHSALIRASIVHDWFYRSPCIITRNRADEVFYHILRNDGINWVRANIMYYAVNLFGWRFYKNCKKGK